MYALLAHSGAGSSWQGLLAAIGMLTAGLFLLVVFGAIKVKDHNDLVLPMAGVVIVSSLSTTSSAFLSDQVGWAAPIGVIALVGLLLYPTVPEQLTWKSPLTGAVIAVAIVSGLILQGPLTRAWHPPVAIFDPASLPDPDDATLTITTPEDRAELTGAFEMVVEVTGATIRNPDEAIGVDPVDPEELGQVRLLVGSNILDVAPAERCTTTKPCTTLTYTISLPAGTYTIYAEFLTAQGSIFSRPVFDNVTVTVS